MFFVVGVFHPLGHFHDPLLDTLQQVCVTPVLRTPHLDTVLQVRPQQGTAEGQDHLPRPAVHASFGAAQGMVGFLGCEGTLLAHVQLAIHKYPQVFLGRAVLKTFIPKLVLIVGAEASQLQDFSWICRTS